VGAVASGAGRGHLRGRPDRVRVGPVLTAEGIACQVAAPSMLQRPAGDRVKTDVRDARHLARLLHLGEITAVAVPSVEQEAARIWCAPARTCAPI
jgi:transposase